MIRHLHMIWGGPEMPDQLRGNMILWRDRHPDWDFTLWGDDDLQWLEHRDLFDTAPELVPADAVWQFRSDLARYEILLKYGGLYVDCDTVPLWNVEPAIAGHDVWAAMEDRHHVGNTYLYSEPHHPLMERIVRGLRASVAANAGKRPNWMTGPRYITPLWTECGAYAAPSEAWFPISYIQARRGEQPEILDYDPAVWAVHQWHHVTTLNGERHAATRRRTRLDRRPRR